MKKNILLCSNKNLYRQIFVLLQSLSENVLNEDGVNVFIFHTDFTDDMEKNISDFCIKKNISVFFYMFSKDDFGNFQTSIQRIPLETFLRLFCADRLPLDIETLLYLDIDIIVSKNINQLFSTSFDEKYICACPGKSPQVYKMNNGQEFQLIFNAGVIFLNLKKLRNDGYFIKKYLAEYDYLLDKCKPSKVPYQDQGLLNYMFAPDKVKLLNSNNFNLRPFKFDKNKYDKDKNYASIIHFTNDGGLKKPWYYRSYSQEKNSTFCYNLWWHYASKTPFYNELEIESMIRDEEKSNINKIRDKEKKKLLNYVEFFKKLADNKLVTNYFFKNKRQKVFLHSRTIISDYLRSIFENSNNFQNNYLNDVYIVLPRDEGREYINKTKVISEKELTCSKSDILIICDTMNVDSIKKRLASNNNIDCTILEPDEFMISVLNDNT